MRQYYWLSDTSSPAPTSSPASNGPGFDDAGFDEAGFDSAALDNDLEKLRRQHQLILNAVGEGVYGVDGKGIVTFVNPAAAAMIGWQPEDLIGQSMHTVLHHSHADGSFYPVAACPIYAAFQDGVVHRVNNEVFWRKDGTSFPVEYISTPMHDEQGNLVGAVVAFRDITQRKWAETVLQQANEELELKVQERTAELQQLNEQLKALSELKSRMVATVCHEFRNPLNNISLSVSYLDRYEGQLSAPQKSQHLGDIQANVERMTQMIDDILVIGKVEAKKVELQPDLLDLVPFCRAVAGEMQAIAPNYIIQFSCPSKSLQAPFDEQLLRSILVNILSNSIRYSTGDRPIRFQLCQRDQHILFQVRDYGMGIPADDLPHLFEPFHRGRNVSNIPGTGLGLSIVKKFVDLHQGKIDVTSQVGQGTTFTVCLPIVGKG